MHMFSIVTFSRIRIASFVLFPVYAGTIFFTKNQAPGADNQVLAVIIAIINVAGEAMLLTNIIFVVAYFARAAAGPKKDKPPLIRKAAFCLGAALLYLLPVLITQLYICCGSATGTK